MLKPLEYGGLSVQLEDFLKDEFAIYFQDEAPTLLISTVDVLKNYSGEVDPANPPKEETLEVSKKKFAEAFVKYIKKEGYKKCAKHKSQFVRHYALDLYTKEYLTPAWGLVQQWLMSAEAN